MSMKNQRFIKVITEIFRIILGITFLFSGFVKAVDPYGTALKIEDYLAAFHLDLFSFFSMPISFLLCGFEFVLGVSLLLGIYRKWTSKLTLLLMGFMTLLTLYLAIANPVSDCGCFGDVLILTNWETFLKNIFLLALAIFLSFHYNYITPIYRVSFEKFSLAYILIFTFMLLSISFYYDSVADFRPYNVGSNLPQKMTVEENQKPVEEIYFIYEKNGERKEFSSSNYPWQDTAWKYIDRVTKIIKPGKLPEINNFTINQYIFNDDLTEITDEIDITDNVLKDENYNFLIIIPFLTEIKEKEVLKFNDISEYTSEYGYNLYCLTSSIHQDVIEAKKSIFPQMIFCGVDEKILKTIVRVNPSLVLMQRGTIIHKWSKPLIPSKEELNKPLEQMKLSKIKKASNSNTKNILLCFFILLIPLTGIKLLEFSKNKKQ